MQKAISIGDLRYIFANLIKEKISVKDIVFIFEKLNDLSEQDYDNDKLLEKLSGDNLDFAVAIAALPQKIKGYGHVKMENYRAVKPEWDALLVSWKNNETISLAAE